MREAQSRSAPAERDERIFAPEQWRKLTDAAPVGDSLGDALRIAIMTGCRLGEIVELEARHVESDGKGFFIHDSKSKNAPR